MFVVRSFEWVAKDNKDTSPISPCRSQTFTIHENEKILFPIKYIGVSINYIYLELKLQF